MKQILSFSICMFFLLNIHATAFSQNNDDTEFFFAIDKSRHNTKAERDSCEMTLLDEFTAMTLEMSEKINLPGSDITNLSHTVSSLLYAINEIRSSSDKFTYLSQEPVHSRIKEQYPNIDIEPYYASNGELCSLAEFSHLTDCLVGMYEIVNEMTKLYYNFFQNHLLNDNYDEDGSISAKLKEQIDNKAKESASIIAKTVLYTEMLKTKAEIIGTALTLGSE